MTKQILRNITCLVMMVMGFTVVTANAARKKKGEPLPMGGPAVLYDTVAPVQIGDTADSLIQSTWKKVEDGGTVIQGDVMMINGVMAAVVHKGGTSVELYAKGSKGWSRRGLVSPIVNAKKAVIQEIKVVETDGTESAVECSLGKDLGIVFSLKVGSPILQATAKGKVGRLRIEAPCRFGILPDFFADDLLVDARNIVIERTEIPSDNFFLHMMGNGEAILAAVWEKNVRDIELALSGDGDNRMFVATDVFFGDKGSIWAAILEGDGIWHKDEVTKDDSRNGKEIKEWVVPFMAKWKANFTLQDGSVSSSPLVDRKGAMEFAGVRYAFHNHALKKRKGGGKKFMAVLLEQDKLGSSESPDTLVRYDGPMVAYPIARFNTPGERLCIDDLMRNCLGMGACEYVLDVEARSPAYVGIFTCSYGKTPGMFIPTGPVFDHYRRTAETWKEDRAFMKNDTKDVMKFITFIQDRINKYLDLRLEILAYLDEAEPKNPGSSEFIVKLKKEMGKPAPVFKKLVMPDVRAKGAAVFQPWMDELMKAMRVDTPDQAEKGFAAAHAPDIGNSADARVAALRRQVKQWRAIATMEMAKNPKVATIAKEIRKRTEAALRNPSSYERPTVW